MLSLLVAAVIASTLAPVVVNPADPTAYFKGDGTALKFDPACRDYTLDTVATDSACAARVAKLEAAPALAIATGTLAKTPNRANDAIDLLERTATATSSPAVHYLIGSVFGTAMQTRPDYARAVRHLAFAADHGNPAAADLLATLLVAGKGVPRDVARAIKLYEFAAANGFPSAAVTLGKLYLTGRDVPKNEARGRAWLDAAAKLDVPPGDRATEAAVGQAKQLAALSAADAKIDNFQLIPAPAPADVKAVRYGTFDNPDIPPTFGFDPAFQQTHYAPYDDPATLARLESGIATLPTPYLYELARRLAARDPDRAMQTYLLARTRMSYDAMRCTDPAAMEALRAWDLVVGGDIRFLFVTKPSAAAATAALAAESKLAADTQPWWVCRAGMTEMTAATEGKSGPLKLKPAADWPALRTTARAQVEALTRAP